MNASPEPKSTPELLKPAAETAAPGAAAARCIRRLAGCAVVGFQFLLPGATGLQAAVLTQTVNQATSTANHWNSAIWGTPAAVPTSDNIYVITNSAACRTPNVLSSSPDLTFAGGWLTNYSTQGLTLKHGNVTTTANLTLVGGTIQHGAGPGGTTNSGLAGTLVILGNSRITAPTAAGPRHIWLAPNLFLKGDGNVLVQLYTNVLSLACDASAYTGNWTNTTGRLEIWSGTTAPLGSGRLALSFVTNSLTFNSTNDLTINNAISGQGSVIKLNTGSVVLQGANTFTGGLINNGGLVVLPGAGSQTYTTIDTNGVLRIADSAAVPIGCALTINPSGSATGRLELSNNVSVFTAQMIAVSLRNNSSPAIESLSGNNLLQDQLWLQAGPAGGSFAALQADAGSSLELAGGLTSGASGNSSVCLQGSGNGLISGPISDGSGPVTMAKTGTGTWTLNSYDGYTGATCITNGVLKLGVSGALPSTAAIHLEAGANFDATSVSGITLGAQTLRGKGAVLGDVTTSAGSVIEVGFAGQYGQLNLSNNLTLGGGDTIGFDAGPSVNDVLNVTGSLTVNGSTTVSLNLLEGIIPNATYRLINYHGTLQGSGSFALVAPRTRQTFALDTTHAGQINLVVSGATSANLVWSGDGARNLWDVNSSRNWNGGSEVFLNGDSVTLDDSGSAIPPLNVAQPLEVASMTVNNTAKSYTLTNSGITALGSLTKRGANVLTLANSDNGFNGPIAIEQGTLSLGDGTGMLGSLGSGPITNQAALVVNLFYSADATTLGGPTLSNAISGTGSVRVTGGGNATTLAGTSTYTGPTTVETNCALYIQNNSALGDPGTGTTVQAGGRLGFTAPAGNWTVAERLALNGNGFEGAGAPGALWIDTAGNTATLTGPVTLESAARLQAVDATLLTFSNTVTAQQPLWCTAQSDSTVAFQNTLSLGSAASLTKDGSGTLILGGNSNLCASTVISNGTLVVTATNPPQIGDVTVYGGRLQIGDGGTNGSFGAGTITNYSTVVLNSAGRLTLANPITGTGALNQYGTGSSILTASNDYTGITAINAGTLVAANNSALGSGPVQCGPGGAASTSRLGLQDDVVLANGIRVYGRTSQNAHIVNLGGTNTLAGPINADMGGNTYNLESADGLLVVAGTYSQTAGTGQRLLNLQGAGNGSVPGTILDGTGSILLTKLGTGTWTLDGINGYSGGTAVSGGTLLVNGQIGLGLSTDSVTVAGGTLGGSGVINGPVTVQSGGTLAPGNPVGTLTINSDLTLLPGSSTWVKINQAGGAHDRIVCTGAITYAGTLSATNVNGVLHAGDTFPLFSSASASGNFSAVSGSPGAGLAWSFNPADGVLSVVPGVALDPTRLTARLKGNYLELAWPPDHTGWRLLAQTNSLINGLGTNWFAVPGSGLVNTVTNEIDPANGSVFYRLVYP